MKSEYGVRVIGTGRAVPDRILTNEDLSKIVDTSDEWISTRTGIKRRHVLSEGENNSDLATLAAERALEDAGVKAEEIDFLIIGTVTADLIFPSLAVLVQDRIGARNAAAWDLSAACSGFLFGLQQARAMLASGQGQKALVLGSEALTRLTNYRDRNTCVLFGDGSGAVVLEACDPEENTILSTGIRSDGSLADLLKCPKGGTADPVTPEIIESGEDKIHMAGKDVFKHAVRNMGSAAEKALEEAGIKAEEVSLLIPHQANTRIMESLAKRLAFPMEKVYMNIEEYGNTSAASIPIALDEAREKGRVKPGEPILLLAFGGGFTWGSALLSIKETK